MTGTPPYDTVSTSSRAGPMFTKCCCCIPLRVGCFILGYTSLIFNTFHTLIFLSLTTYIGIYTHGFDHLDRKPYLTSGVPDTETADIPFLMIGIFLTVVLCANVIWLVINVACLVGLHKRRPGPIRVYVGFATARLILSLTGFVCLRTTIGVDIPTLISYSIEFGLAAYFIMVYYIYAAQLKKERAEVQEKPLGSDIYATDISFVYPSKMEKQILVA